FALLLLLFLREFLLPLALVESLFRVLSGRLLGERMWRGQWRIGARGLGTESEIVLDIIWTADDGLVNVLRDVGPLDRGPRFGGFQFDEFADNERIGLGVVRRRGVQQPGEVVHDLRARFGVALGQGL